ncbi:ABC transporter ATP-binding protein [Thalassotalea sp. SU-HH00458]|uniref:ABC transporter ATP-binding protein n=1 Tax=Thalassotalea sp. SU-HH00458 TaxID=3127657 RepID=UPI0031091454
MSTSPIISLSNVGKQYAKLTALNSIDMQLNQGEVLGLFGHNGAGKTTMMKLILGVISPSHGEVNVMGVAPDSKAAWHMREQIGYLPENVSFYEHLTGLEVLTYFARLKGFYPKPAKQHAIELLEQVGVVHAMKKPVKTFSKGMRQRLGLAQAFIGKPKLLLLDEPTVGLDPIATADFYRTVDQLKSQGSSVILCSHVLPGVEQHIDRAMILSSGNMLAIGTLAELRRQANLPIKITPHGLNGALRQDAHLLKFLESGDSDSVLMVPEQDKVAMLRYLLAFETIDDIDVDKANLEQVYQYYLQQNKSDSKVKNLSTGA